MLTSLWFTSIKHRFAHKRTTAFPKTVSIVPNLALIYGLRSMVRFRKVFFYIQSYQRRQEHRNTEKAVSSGYIIPKIIFNKSIASKSSKTALFSQIQPNPRIRTQTSDQDPSQTSDLRPGPQPDLRPGPQPDPKSGPQPDPGQTWPDPQNWTPARNQRKQRKSAKISENRRK